jgi:drug/metabolite transporter (DMT)-like permease
MGESSRTASHVDYGLLVLLGILLGIPYALTKISQITIPPLTGVAARVLIAAIVLWVFVFISGTKLSMPGSCVRRLFIQGFISCVIPYTLIAYGQTTVNSALAAILNSTTPLFVCVVSLLWARHESLTPGRLVGVWVGLSGVILIAGVNSLTGLGQDTFGQAAIILASASSAVAAIQGRRLNDVAPELAAAGTLTCGAVILVPLCFVVEAPLHSTPSVGSITALLINAFVATALRSVIYFRLLRTIGSMATTSVSYFKPAVGVLIGFTLMGEEPTWAAAIGLLAIFLGVAVISKPKSSTPSWLMPQFVQRAIPTPSA